MMFNSQMINFNDNKSHWQEIACNVTEQTNDKRNRNEEEKNNNEKGEDDENEMKVITLRVEKMLTSNEVMQKAHVKLWK